jgi:LytR cell envelope-related transcriptional attenuator
LLLHDPVGRLAAVDDPPANDAEPPERQAGNGHRAPVGRAVLVLAVFVLATVLLLGRIHSTPTTAASAAGTGPSSATTTTTHPRTTTTTTAPRPPSNVPVLVANASGVTGAAATISSRLQAAGWTTQAPIDASTNQRTSHVYYVAGQRAAADGVAATLRLPASEVLPYTTAAPVSTIGTAEVLVAVGPDLAGPATTTTTVS